MSGSVTQHDALLRLGASSADAISGTLEMFAPGAVTRGEVKILSEGEDPFATILPGTVAADVSYVDGVTGGNIFLAAPATARALATLMGAGEPDDPDGPLTELELSAVSEASNQMMASAAGAIGEVLGQEIEISPPRCAQIDSATDADAMFGAAPYVTVTAFAIAGEPCRLVQLIPGAFVSRISRALDDLSVDLLPSLPTGHGADPPPPGLRLALEDISLRVWVELGRIRVPLGDALALPVGTIMELDRVVEEPAGLFVNGVRFAHGHLMVDDAGRWTFQIDCLDNDNSELAPEEPALAAY